MTHKLFHDDVNIREFDADVVKCEPLSKELRSKYEGGAPLYAVWLDKTAFYAEAGGQPADHGTLGGANVLDVQEDETGDIYHVTAAPLEGSVHGALDWTRRFSNMQQHGGQHLISWAVHKYLGGYTFGLHTGAQECTIDTDLKEVPSRETLDMLENAVNGLIWQDLPVHQWFPSDEELKTLPLRKKPTVSENIRIVMTGDVECVACCGTHPTSSGQIGLVTILGAHPARGKVRISFLCGGRAHARLRAEADACREAGAMLSATYETLAQETRRVLDNAREQAHVLSEFRREALIKALLALYENAPELPDSTKLIAHRFDSADRDGLIKAASGLIENPRTVALLAAGNADGAGDIAVFACSDDVKLDMGKFMREALKAYGGRGGGKPGFAQGGAPTPIDPAALEDAFKAWMGEAK